MVNKNIVIGLVIACCSGSPIAAPPTPESRQSVVVPTLDYDKRELCSKLAEHVAGLLKKDEWSSDSIENYVVAQRLACITGGHREFIDCGLSASSFEGVNACRKADAAKRKAAAPEASEVSEAECVVFASHLLELIQKSPESKDFGLEITKYKDDFVRSCREKRMSRAEFDCVLAVDDIAVVPECAPR